MVEWACHIVIVIVFIIQCKLYYNATYNEVCDVWLRMTAKITHALSEIFVMGYRVFRIYVCTYITVHSGMLVQQTSTDSQAFYLLC